MSKIQELVKSMDRVQKARAFRETHKMKTGVEIINRMKNFLSFKKFKEHKIMFILVSLIILLGLMLINANNLDVNYWDWRAFFLATVIWLISSAVDKDRYWNLAHMLGVNSFMYIVWWAIFKILFTGI